MVFIAICCGTNGCEYARSTIRKFAQIYTNQHDTLCRPTSGQISSSAFGDYGMVGIISAKSISSRDVSIQKLVLLVVCHQIRSQSYHLCAEQALCPPPPQSLKHHLRNPLHHILTTHFDGSIILVLTAVDIRIPEIQKSVAVPGTSGLWITSCSAYNLSVDIFCMRYGSL